MLFVPTRVGHIDPRVIRARGGGVFARGEGEAGVPETLVLLKCLLRVALRPKHFPNRGALGGGRSHKLSDVAAHLCEVERERADIPSVLPFGGVDRRVFDLGQGSQGLQQDAAVASAGRHIPRIQPRQLGEADGGLHLGQAIVPSDAIMDVRKLLLQGQEIHPLLHIVAVIANAPRLPRQLLVIGRDHSALAPGGKGLVLAETATGHVPQRAGLPAAVGAAQRFGVVLDHPQVIFPGQSPDRVHVADIPIQVDRHEGLRAGGHELLGRLHAQAMVLQVDIGKPRNRPRLDDGKTGGDKRVAGHDHFVARPDAKRGQPDVERRRAGGGADGVAASLPSGKGFLELHAPLAGPVVDLAGTENLFDGLNGPLVEGGPMGQGCGDGFRPAMEREFLGSDGVDGVHIDRGVRVPSSHRRRYTRGDEFRYFCDSVAFIQLKWGVHAPSRAVAGALADPMGAPGDVTVW